MFELLIDGVVVDAHDFDKPECCPVQRSTSAHSLFVSAGNHEIRFRMLRPFTTGESLGVTPFQFIDNVTVSAVPLPGALILFASAIATIRHKYART